MSTKLYQFIKEDYVYGTEFNNSTASRCQGLAVACFEFNKIIFSKAEILQNVKLLHGNTDDYNSDNNEDVTAIAIPRVFSEKSQATKLLILVQIPCSHCFNVITYKGPMGTFHKTAYAQNLYMQLLRQASSRNTIFHKIAQF